MKNTLTFSNIINILIDNKKNTYPQYLLVADLFGLDLGIGFYAGETLGVTDSKTIRISNWCTGTPPAETSGIIFTLSSSYMDLISANHLGRQAGNAPQETETCH